MGHKARKDESLVKAFGQLIDKQTNYIAKVNREKSGILPAFYRNAMVKKGR